MKEAITLLWVLAIDMALSIDNAAVIALVTGKLPEQQRKHAMWYGIGLAMALRIVCACFAAELMKVAFLSLLGGAYLMHVAAKLACEQLGLDYSFATLLELLGIPWPFKRAEKKAEREPVSIKEAVIAIGLADLSMSLDNVLAVAGTAKHHPVIMMIGLVFSILAMFLAAAGIHKMLEKWPKSAWVAVALVFVTGCKLVFDGALAAA
jgi:YjbE family integral membrane protein